VLQEVFAASFNAMIADSRPINARPWLYRIARNRCLNHLRRPTSAGQDSMDIFERDGGATTADTVSKREEFRQIVADVQDLPETQRTALLLREIDALSYDDIAATMDTTVPSVKSLLVRARVSLAEAAEARLLTCEEVRLELGEVAEGLARSSAPARRHLKGCERCRVFKGELRKANKALAAVYPLGPLVLVKKFFAAKVGFASGAGASTAGGGSGAAGGAGFAGGAAAATGSVAGSAGAGGLLSAGFGTVASKAVAGFAAAAIVTAGAVEAKHVAEPQSATRPAVAAVIAPPSPVIPAPPPKAIAHPRAVALIPQPKSDPAANGAAKSEPASTPAPQPAIPAPVDTTPAQPPVTAHTTQPTQPVTQEDSSTVVLTDEGNTSSPGSDGSGSGDGGGSGSGSGSGQSSPPGEPSSSPPQPQPAPIVGEPDPGGRLLGDGGSGGGAGGSQR
jgi:RNA polymerase sigma factor (sigma-70 family)